MSEILFSDNSETAELILEQHMSGARIAVLDLEDARIEFDDPHQFARLADIIQACANEWLALDAAELKRTADDNPH